MAQQIKIKTGVIALLAIVLGYSGCKKNSTTKNTTTVSATDKQASLQVVRDVVNVIMGGLGDPSYTNVSVNSVGQQHGKLAIDATTGSGCAFTIDTTFNFTATDDTITVSVKGPVKLSTTCGSGGNIIGGYTTVGNYVEVITTPSLSLNYSLTENTVTTAVTVADSTNTVLNGTESVSAVYNYANGKTGTQAYTYTFHAVTSGAITAPFSGSTDYTAKVSGIFGDWSYSGTLTFVSNIEVKITLGGNTFLVNTATGEIVVSS